MCSIKNRLVSRFMSTALFISVVFSLFGCESTPVSNAIKIKARTVMILPAESLSKELNSLSLIVQNELVEQIKNEDFIVIFPTVEEYAKLREEALIVSGSLYDPNVGKLVPLKREVYSKALIDLCSEKFPNDILLIPELVLRTAVVTGDKAVWDNAEKEITFITAPQVSYRLPPRTRALSLKLGAFTPKGAEVINVLNGISLPYDLDYQQAIPTLELKNTFFTEDELSEGIEMSLKSFFIQVELQEK